ncbi:hypothetical protein SBA3_3390004 [Candidatus Sulfopaludibacter sp. SbA3]|nr:hypothetical protein SBA3_3390004 [Candidatus Sulfopaludibacter sp. SbA3]
MEGSRADVTELTIPYCPLPSQRAFHDCRSRFKGFSGPIGSGKSQALCQEAIKLSYINQGRTGLLGAPTYPMLRDATQACLLEILEESGIRYDHNKSENTIVFRDTRSKILLRAVGHQSGLVRPGRADLYAGGCVAAAGRQAARSESKSIVRVRGVDAEGFRLGLQEIHCAGEGGRIRGDPGPGQ